MSKKNEKHRFTPMIYLIVFVCGLLIGLTGQNPIAEKNYSKTPTIIYSLGIDNRIDLTIQAMDPPYLISIGLTFDGIVNVENNYSIFLFIGPQLQAPDYFAIEYNDIDQTLVYYSWYNIIWKKDLRATIDLNFDIQPVAVWIQIDEYRQPIST